MPTFITLISDLDETKKDSRGTVIRAEFFIKRAKEMGVRVLDLYWTQGQYDGIAILEAPDSETVSALMLSIITVRSHTLRAYTPDEIKQIVSKIPI